MELRNLLVLLVGIATQVTLACYITGADSGICDERIPSDTDYREALMPYCAKYIKYIPCVPRDQYLPPSRQFPEGRWGGHTIQAKDAWIKQTTEDLIKYRLKVEVNKTNEDKGVDEFGVKGKKTAKRFSENPDCKNAFRAYACWINFPRCDDQDNSLMMCRSACENFFLSCEAEQFMRCGPSEFMNEYVPEQATGPEQEFLRDFFPGQPFRDYEPGKCTPGIRGSAAVARPSLGLIIALAAAGALYAGFA